MIRLDSGRSSNWLAHWTEVLWWSAAGLLLVCCRSVTHQGAACSQRAALSFKTVAEAMRAELLRSAPIHPATSCQHSGLQGLRLRLFQGPGPGGGGTGGSRRVCWQRSNVLLGCGRPTAGAKRKAEPRSRPWQPLPVITGPSRHRLQAGLTPSTPTMALISICTSGSSETRRQRAVLTVIAIPNTITGPHLSHFPPSCLCSTCFLCSHSIKKTGEQM